MWNSLNYKPTHTVIVTLINGSRIPLEEKKIKSILSGQNTINQTLALPLRANLSVHLAPPQQSEQRG
ncbi:hypothetical protein L484_021360 [Morus notabilis]|uniref:Uncharacterized protein n=1 Tax=Morus notabilis TaxID=981085 RepID=W9RQG0_9ROSA|nr:hypothetical protein L484_021360 [Morus notabilis]